MSELPEDVMKAAREVAITVQKQWNEYHSPTVKEVRLVAAAILAERERCAKIAESAMLGENSMLAGTGRWAVHDGACIEIAKAIRA